MICDCLEFQQNADMINACIRFSEIHSLPLPEDYQSFRYCPWCGEKLLRETQEAPE